ncbi:glycosyltransferase [Gemmatimonas sp.]|uniref:glycosyltransferase n=1 Tax=Gemmatimonas sp. TaxID=1962908 RepID=UPI00286D8F31|nr:glycosyltransferase [Gemmatimonas sp.]
MGVKQAFIYPAHGSSGKAAKLLRSALTGRSYWEELFFRSQMHEDLRREVEATPAGVPSAIVLDTVYLAPVLRGISASTPIALTHHNIESNLLESRAAAASGAKRLIFSVNAGRTRSLEVTESQRAAINLMVSEEDGDRLCAVAGAVPVAIVPNGVDVDFFREDQGAVRKPHSLVFAGGMDWFPNRDAIEWLCSDIWPQLVADEPRRTLTIIGRSPPVAATALASRDTRVRVLGFVDDVRPYISEASAYLCPIRLGGGTRLKVLDALAMRRPLIATGLSVDGLALESGRHYLRADTGEQFAGELRRLDDDNLLYARLQAEGRAHVEERFSWRFIGGELFQAIDAAAR